VLDQGDNIVVGRYPLALRIATPTDWDDVRGLVREAAEWLRDSKDTDQWTRPWPDQLGQSQRIRNDLLRGQTWLVWDDTTAAATITIGTEESVGADDQPVWPAHKRHELALYIRRLVVSRSYAGLGLGAALMNWAAAVANREHGARLIRIAAWTTNLHLHAYLEGQGFTRSEGMDPRELSDYPAQALFERVIENSGSGYTRLLTKR
jgi:GNAT superfamily N-acetyltransferase